MASTSFSYESVIPADASDVFSYYGRNLSILRLTPPWETLNLLNITESMKAGSTIDLRIRLGCLKTSWQVKRVEFANNRTFVMSQSRGPFRHWKHTQSIRSLGDGTSSLRDLIQFSLPFGQFSNNRLGNYLARKRLERLFSYRHSITQSDMRHCTQMKTYPKTKVAITGGNGLIGSELSVYLQAQGHQVTILSRSGKSRIWGVPAEQWDPRSKAADWEKLEGIDSWIHLAGENLASGRWTSKKMRSLRNSRVESARFLAEGFKKMSNPPKVFIGASGIGYYGDGAEAELTETESKGSGFLADLCEDWEGASAEMEAMGIRRVILRMGMVLTPKGGALAKLLPLYKAGLGGRQGRGTQYWSWIAMDDLLRVFHVAMLNPHFRGVYNAVSPTPVQNHEFSSILAGKVNRPGVCSVPGGVLKFLLGKMANESLLASQRVLPQRLKECGIQFDFPTLDLALSHLLGKH